MNTRPRVLGELRRRLAAAAAVLTTAASPRSAPRSGRGTNPRPMAWEGGRVDPFDQQFNPRKVSLNALNEVDLAEARWRSHWLCQNDPKIRGARETNVRRFVGKGPLVNPAVEAERSEDAAAVQRANELSDQIREWWKWFSRAVDPSRTRGLRTELQTAERHYFATGEMLPRIVDAPAFNGFPGMPALEMISTARLDLNLSAGGYSSTLYQDVPAGHTVRQGVEYDAENRVAAYHVLVADPNDQSALWYGKPNQTVRVPVSEAVLRFSAEEHGQVRGVPKVIAAIRTARDARGYKSATMRMAQLMTACGIIWKGVSPPKPRTGGLENSAVDQNGNAIAEWYEGQSIYLPATPNADVEIKAPTLPGNNFDALLRVYDRDAARAIGQTYPTFSGDGAGETYAQRRAGLLEEQDESDAQRMDREEWIITPLYTRFVAWLVAMGHLGLTEAELERYLNDPDWLTRHSVIWPSYGWIDPLKEATAQQVGLQIGSTSRPRIAMAAGADWRQLIDESSAAEAYENSVRARLGLPPKAQPAPANTGVQTPQNQNQSAPAQPDPSEPPEKEDAADPESARRKDQPHA